MYKKAIVLEVKTAYALAMEEGGAVLRIRLKDGLAVGDAIYVLPEDLYQAEGTSGVVPFPAGGRDRTKTGKSRRPSPWLRLGGMAAILVLCVTLLFPRLTPVAYAVASFDGDTSIQVRLDQRGRILSASSPDGSMQQKELDGLKGKSLEDAAAALSAWCGDGSLLIGYALIGGGEEDPATLRSIQAFFSEQPVVCLSGAAGDIHAADGQSVSLGRYLIARMENEDLDEILEELPPETIGKLLEETPAWSSHPEFQEALEEQLEKQTEDEEQDSGPEEPDEEPERPEPPSEEPDEEPERLETPSEEPDEEPERPEPPSEEPEEDPERPETPSEEPEEEPEEASPSADGEAGQPDRSPAEQPEREDAPDEGEQAQSPEDSGDPPESRPGEGPSDGEEGEAPADRNDLESGGAAGEDGPEKGEQTQDQPEDETDGAEPSESETNEEADTSGAEADEDAEPAE